jgi:hypothetical protein
MELQDCFRNYIELSAQPGLFPLGGANCKPGKEASTSWMPGSRRVSRTPQQSVSFNPESTNHNEQEPAANRNGFSGHSDLAARRR